MRGCSTSSLIWSLLEEWLYVWKEATIVSVSHGPTRRASVLYSGRSGRTTTCRRRRYLCGNRHAIAQTQHLIPTQVATGEARRRGNGAARRAALAQAPQGRETMPQGLHAGLQGPPGARGGAADAARRGDGPRASRVWVEYAGIRRVDSSRWWRCVKSSISYTWGNRWGGAWLSCCCFDATSKRIPEEL